MRIKVLSGGRKNIELPLSDAELNLQMRRIGIEETVPMCRLVEVSEQDNPLHRFEGQTVNMDEVNFFAKRMESLTEYERKVLSAYAEDYDVATMQDFQHLIEGKCPSLGYHIIALLAENEIVKSVWTTNFDGLMLKTAHSYGLVPIEVTLESQDRIFRNDTDKELLCMVYLNMPL